jgi:hypothetical protein
MIEKAGNQLAWIRTGSLCGVIAAVFFLCAQFAPIPDQLSISLIMAFGPLMMLGFIGMYHYLRDDPPRVLLQIAVLYGIIAGAFIDMMVITQLSVRHFRKEALANLPEGVTESTAKAMYQVGNAVQLGMDVSFDTFILPAIILFGIALLSSNVFNKVLGVIGLGLGLLGLFNNLYTFPIPPIDVGLIDVGPFAMLWSIVLFVKIAIEGWTRR